MTSPEAPGLRERKKADTRAAIQRHALRLFREQGYDATSIEQIAQAADVSHRTVFRYFPTKEALVTLDDYDTLIAAAYAAQPAELGPVTALRNALRAVLTGVTDADIAAKRERQALVLSVPSLWAASLANITRTKQTLTDLVAARLDRPPYDDRVRAVSGAVFGILLSTWLDWAHDPGMDAPASLDRALAHLESSLNQDHPGSSGLG
ncbi:TetR family transcriptional regulator [Nonomuraea sp. NPDC003804]|uniref:TetR/AcrR family transcriptional regulator n=1 Tax=Nonomuraea sp. NPDC003804 TaxID=3154547 RepID=UPI0033A5B4F9